MKKKTECRNVVLCDRDVSYIHRLSLAIAKRRKPGISVVVFSEPEDVVKYAETEDIHILVLGEHIWLQVSAEETYRLCEERECEDDRHLYKYQSVDVILAKILEEEENVRRLDTGTTRIIGVYSPIHRCGKTTFALTLGKILAQKCQVLYLNLEEYAGINGMFDSGGDTLADYIYFQKQEQTDLTSRLGMMVKQLGKLEYIAPMILAEEIKTITTNEWMELIESIVKHSVYQVLILDMGDSIQGTIEILEQCHHIYMPVLNDPISQSKSLQFEQNLKLLQKELLLHKVTPCFLPEWVEGKSQFMMEGYVKRMIEKGEIQ